MYEVGEKASLEAAGSRPGTGEEQTGGCGAGGSPRGPPSGLKGCEGALGGSMAQD